MNVAEFKQYTRTYKAVFSKLYKGKWVRYHNIYAGFDIETTEKNEHSYMYIWQFGFLCPGLEQVVVKGRTWSEFEELLKFLKKRFGLRDNTRLIIWIANMSYEFQFIKHRIGFIDELFAKTTRNPLLVRCGGIEFRDALPISQGGLAYLAKTWTTTQKMVGDLDYSKQRNSMTPLEKETEEKYCDNDVIILSEFSQKIFEEYINKEHYIPLTSTGILRHDLKKAALATVKDPDRIYHWIKGLFPKTKADYLYIMEWLFRGGFVHACYQKVGQILENYHSFDLKSSYPASAFQKYFPVTPFKEVKNVSRETLDRLCEKYCVIFTVTFYDIEATTPHTIESLSKCIKIAPNARGKPKGHLLDNGRVRKAKYMTVMLTELDYQTYKEFYKWDEKKTKIHHVEIAARGTLPKYLLDRFYHWFDLKESTDKHADPQGFAIIKTRINGHFGLCVTRLCFLDVCYDLESDWHYEETDQSYDEMISKQVLSPFWGIYICSHSRRTELSLLYKMRNEVAYSDTDSHKLKLTPNVINIVNSFNDSIRAQNRAICAKYGYDINVLENIGILEQETSPENKGVMLRFKTMGAKRYICEYENEGFESTISGLKKGALNEYCKEREEDGVKIPAKDPFTFFDKGMMIPEKYTEKLTPVYCDTPTSDTVIDEYGNIEVMRERSSVWLKPATFELTLDKDYEKLIRIFLERMVRNAN